MQRTTIESIVIPKYVTKIGDKFLLENRYLKEITIPDSLESVGEDFLSGCSALKKIKMSRNAKVKLSDKFKHLIVYKD